MIRPTEKPSAMTMKITTGTSPDQSSFYVKMQVQLLYGPEVLIEVDPQTYVGVFPPR